MNSFTFKGVTYEVIPNGNHFTVFKGTPSEREVTSEEVENLYKHALDAFDELNVYKEVHEKWGVQL